MRRRFFYHCLFMVLGCVFIPVNAGENSSLNLIPGDTDVELETHGMTSGLFSNSYAVAPRWRHVTDVGYDSNSSIMITQPNTSMGIGRVRLPRGKYTFSFYAKALNPGARGYIAVTADGYTWNQVLKSRRLNSFTLSNEWQRYSVVFESDGKKQYSGHYGSYQSGVFFDRFMINAGTRALPYVPSAKQRLLIKIPDKTGNVFSGLEPLPMEVVMKCYTPERPQGNIVFTITDFTGQIVLQDCIKPIWDRHGEFKSQLTLKLKRSGWFKVAARHENCNLDYFTTIVLVRPSEPSVAGVAPFVGLCGAEKTPEIARLLGVKLLQIHIFWNAIERLKGHYDFSSMEYVRKLKQQGFKIQALLPSYPPEWAVSPEFRSAMKKQRVPYTKSLASKKILDEHYRPMMRECLKRYPNLIDIFELGGELDALMGLNVYYKSRDNKNMVGPFVLGESYDLLCHMMSIAAEEILQAQPNAKISSVRPSDVDARHRYAYSRAVFKRLGKYMNCFGVDCYPQPRWIGPNQPETGTEQQLADRLRDARKAMAGLVKSNEVMISEYGYFIDIDRIFDPRYSSEQINRLARSYLKARLLGMNSLFYYTTRNPNLEGQRYYMALWHDGKPLAAVASLNSVARVVENVTACRELKMNPKLGIGVFKKYDNRAVAAVWSIDSRYTPQIEFADDNFVITDVMGNPVDKKVKNGKITLQLSPLPYYIWRTEKVCPLWTFFHEEYEKNNYEKLERALENMEIKSGYPLKITLRMSSQKHLKAYLQNNLLKKTISGVVMRGATSSAQTLSSFEILPNSQQLIYLPLPQPGESQQLIFKVNADYPPKILTWETPPLVTVRRIAPQKLSQKFVPYPGVKPVEISGKSHIHPVDHTTYDGIKDLSAQVYLAHDGKYFYFAAQVTDDWHFNRFNSKKIWRGDCVQLGFDPEMNFIRDVNDLDDDDVTLSCGLQNSGATLAVHYGRQQYALQQAAEYQVHRNETTKQTVYQIKLPLELLGKNLRSGAIWGFNCVFMDDDTNSGADYWLFWRQGLAGGLRPDRFVPVILE